MKKTLGYRIKELRESREMTQAELAAKLYVSDKTISKWEKDKSEPEISVLVKIAEIFNVTNDYLLLGITPTKDYDAISKIELACREDNIALLDDIDLEAFDDNGKNVEYYANKYKAKNVLRFLNEWKIDKKFADGFTYSENFILGIPPKMEGEDNLKVLAWGGPYEKAVEECAHFEKDGFHHFKVLKTIDVNAKIEKDYQFFWAKILDRQGKTRMIISTAIFDDNESGVLSLTIFRPKTYKENKHVDGKLVPDYYPKSEKEIDGRYYIKPSVLKKFMDLLSELDVKNWENRHWGVPIWRLFYVLENEPKDDQLACHKYYVAPGREAYKKFVSGLQDLLINSLSVVAYKRFVNYFDNKYIPYYRFGMPIYQSKELFKMIEDEMENIKAKKFVNEDI